MLSNKRIAADDRMGSFKVRASGGWLEARCARALGRLAVPCSKRLAGTGARPLHAATGPGACASGACPSARRCLPWLEQAHACEPLPTPLSHTPAPSPRPPPPAFPPTRTPANMQPPPPSDPPPQVGDVVEGTVMSVKPYGAFVDIGGASGLLHISQISHDRIANVDKVWGGAGAGRGGRGGGGVGPAGRPGAACAALLPVASLPSRHAFDAHSHAPALTHTRSTHSHTHDFLPWTGAGRGRPHQGDGAEPGPRARPRGAVHKEAGADARRHAARPR